MPTNEELVKRIIAAIEEKTADREVACPVCGSMSWEVASHFVALPGSQKATRWRPRLGVFPLIPLMCAKCGNTQFINLLGLGFKKEEVESLEFNEDVD